MIKTTFIFLLTLFFTAGAAKAQQSKPLIPDNLKMLSPGNGYLNSINTRAIRDFVKRHKNATDAIWYKVYKGFVVRFFIDSLYSWSAYKTNGYWVYTIKQYQEAKMPKAVRHLIKSTYYDYEITLVEEIELPDEPVCYVVHLQDSVSFKNILVSKGQMDVLEDKKKL